jgi:predicted patatin/cPLA2 family phospholipase
MKNLKDYITESNGIKWFDIIKQQLIKYTESRGDVTTLREVYNYIRNNEVINSTLKSVFKKPDHFEWIKLGYSDLFGTHIQLSDSKRRDWTQLERVIKFEYKPNKHFKIELKKPEHLEQSIANKTKLNKYTELIEDIKKIAKKDWTESDSGNYTFEI